VTIQKENKKQDTLDVATVVVEGAPTTSKNDITRFNCGSYKFGARDVEKSRYCLKAIKDRPAPLVNLKINKIVVRVGPDGTDDDVFMQICDTAKCCHTKELHHLLSSEWVPNKLETWDGSKLGNCSSILLDSGALGLDVHVLKSTDKQDTLDITSIIVEGAPTTDKTNIIRFNCASFQFGKKDAKKSRYCSNSQAAARRPSITTRPTTRRPPPTTRRPPATTRRPPATTRKPTATTRRPIPGSKENLKLSEIIVQMGKDGTNDDVSMKICHEKDNKCCETGNLDGGFLSDDWSRNDKETWNSDALGVCKNLHWDACKGLAITLKKKASKDTMKVSNITVKLADKDNERKVERFTCPDYTFTPTDKEQKHICTLDIRSTAKCSIPPTTRRPSITTRRPQATTKRGSSVSRVTIKPLFPNSNLGDILIKKFEVEIGKDGTRDPVTVEVCSGSSCCSTSTLSKLPLSNSWQRNTNESWTSSDLGECRNKKLSITDYTTVTNLQESYISVIINQKGRDGLKLENFNIVAETAVGSSRRFKCGKILVVDSFVTKDCFWRGGVAPSRTGPCLRSGRNCETTKKTTTTRRPFRSGK